MSKRHLTVTEAERAFIESLASRDIWVLAVGLRNAPPVRGVIDEGVYAAIADHRIDMGELTDDDSILPFNYRDDDGDQILPFFSTDEFAREFAKRGPPNPASPFLLDVFQPCRLLAGFVATPENDDFVLLFDPWTPGQRRLTEGERVLLRNLSNEA